MLIGNMIFGQCSTGFALVADMQSLLRELGGRKGQPTTVLIDSRTLQSTPESGARAGYDGAKRRRAPRSTSRSIRWGTCWR